MSDKKTRNTILIITGALSILLILAFSLPHLIRAYKCVSPCSSVESDADNIAAAIADYFSIPGRDRINPGDLNDGFTSHNPWTFIQCGDNIHIYVHDHRQGCPLEYQNDQSGWDSHLYTKIIRF